MRRATAVLCVCCTLLAGCASSVPKTPSITPIEAIDLESVRRFPEEEVVFKRGDSRKRIAYETLSLSTGAGAPRLMLAGQALELPVGSKPRNPVRGYGWSVLLIVAGAALIATADDEEEPNPAGKEQADPEALGALTAGLGVFGLFGTARQRRNAVRYAEAESRPMQVAEGPFKYVVRAKTLYKWTGGSHEVERVQVRLSKETTPEYESALRRARSSAEKGDFDEVGRVLEPFMGYADRDPELEELLSFTE